MKGNHERSTWPSLILSPDVKKEIEAECTLLLHCRVLIFHSFLLSLKRGKDMSQGILCFGFIFDICTVEHTTDYYSSNATAKTEWNAKPREKRSGKTELNKSRRIGDEEASENKNRVVYVTKGHHDLSWQSLVRVK